LLKLMQCPLLMLLHHRKVEPDIQNPRLACTNVDTCMEQV
jgi:hypothetical protein